MNACRESAFGRDRRNAFFHDLLRVRLPRIDDVVYLFPAAKLWMCCGAFFCGRDPNFAAGIVTENWRAFMRFQIDRARRLYDEAAPGIQMLDADGRFAIAAAANLYRAILNKIEENDYDVLTQRASVGAWGKIRRLPGIWWSSRVDA